MPPRVMPAPCPRTGRSQARCRTIARRRAAAGAPAAARSSVLSGHELDGHVDAVGVVAARYGAAGAGVGPAAADDGHVVGVTLGRDLAVGQGDRATALLVLAPPVGGHADELRAADAGAGGGGVRAVGRGVGATALLVLAPPVGGHADELRAADAGAGGVEDAVAGDRGVPGDGGPLCERRGGWSMTWNDCARSTIWRVPVGGPGACVTGPSAASATPAVAQPALARATARRAGRIIWSPEGRGTGQPGS